VRRVIRREVIDFHGQTIDIPLPEGQGTGLGKPLKLINRPVRDAVPIWWASLMGNSVAATAEVADGWLPVMFIPEKADSVWGDDLRRGNAKRSPDLGPLDISAGGLLAIGDDLPVDKIRDMGRPGTALYVGGMGARGKNFYNDLAVRYGFEQAAKEIQDLYLDGKKEEAAAKVPEEWLEKTSLVGPVSYIKDRVAAYKEAGVTVLNVNPVGSDPVKAIDQLREIVGAA
jgi:F420-dependent oxidoreductase-like protein